MYCRHLIRWLQVVLHSHPHGRFLELPLRLFLFVPIYARVWTEMQEQRLLHPVAAAALLVVPNRGCLTPKRYSTWSLTLWQSVSTTRHAHGFVVHHGGDWRVRISAAPASSILYAPFHP